MQSDSLFPLGVVPNLSDDGQSVDDITTVHHAFMEFPLMDRQEILNELGAPLDDETYVTAYRYLRENKLMGKFIIAVNKATNFYRYWRHA